VNNRLGNNTLAQRNAQQAGGNVTTVTLGERVRVMADRINNTLLIYAMPGEYERIEATLKRLDVQRAQVLIEASIIEVTLTDELQYGLQWAFNNGFSGGRKGVGLLSNGPGTRTITTFDNDGKPVSTVVATSIANATKNFSYTLTNKAGDIAVLLQALATKSLIRVISSPSLMVLDNHTAAIQVGKQVPVATGTTSTTDFGGGIVNNTSTQYKDTGVMLDVTPSISAGDLITLDINQTVTNVSDTDPLIDGNSTFMQRQISSMVAVRSGETMVLGGLIQDSASNGKSGLPLLSSIPILGALFGSHQTNSDRTELLIVITPRVVRSDEDARAVSRELRERMRGITFSSGASAP
jgi:general secretion pathway protein D